MLEIGFGSAIRREWAWRVSRGESVANLAAFAHFAAPSTTPPRQDPALPRSAAHSAMFGLFPGLSPYRVRRTG
jgi:hypothetical protein